jgi:hypothetical protein
MQSYFDKKLNRKVLYHDKLFIEEVKLKIINEVSEKTGGNDYFGLIRNEYSRVRFLYAIHETFLKSPLVARDVFNNCFNIDNYEQKKEYNFTSSASIVEQAKKLYSNHSIVTITEYDYDEDKYSFIPRWFKLLKKPLYKHNKREITDVLTHVGYKITVRNCINSIDTNPLYKYYIDCAK